MTFLGGVSVTPITIVLAALISFYSIGSNAFTLWSTHDLASGPGEFHGPGSFDKDQVLFEMIIRNIAFYGPANAVVPFYNNGALEPNICGDGNSVEAASGVLSGGEKINENIDMCLATIADTDMVIATIGGGGLQGQQIVMFEDDGSLSVAMDIALDLGIGSDGVIKMPFWGTTGQLEIPLSLQAQLGIPGGIDRAGILKSGSILKGKLGDADSDGWLDGTLVAAGNMPLDSPVFPGQPYAMIRHFEIDLEASGSKLGDIASLKQDKVESN